MTKTAGESKRNGRIVLAAIAGLLIAQAGVISSDVRGTGSRVERIFLDMQEIVIGLRQAADAGQIQGDTEWIAGPGTTIEAEFAQSAGSMVNVAGDFINILMPDPWGRSYFANIGRLAAGHRTVRVLCAGPDGKVQTPANAHEAEGDDFLLHLD